MFLRFSLNKKKEKCVNQSCKMSDLEVCGGGFLTFNQSILIVVVAAALVVIALLAIIVISYQYNKVITIIRSTGNKF